MKFHALWELNIRFDMAIIHCTKAAKNVVKSCTKPVTIDFAGILTKSHDSYGFEIRFDVTIN